MRRTLHLAAAFAFSGPALAAPEAYEFDKSHAEITYGISHLGYSTSLGRFGDFDGTLVLDFAKPTDSKVSVTIKADSLDSGWGPRDTHLKTADFFNVEKFPTITFTSKTVKVDSADKNKAEVTGDFTLLGVTKPVTLSVMLNKAAPNPRSGVPTAGFTATAMIKRSDFGMKFGVPAIGDDVTITINIEARSAAGAPAAPAPK